MAEYAYPMDSNVTYNGNGVPTFDRAVTSAQLRGMIGEIITNGVLMANNSNALRVVANGDKSVTIQPGLCVINGAIKKFTEAKTMNLPVSSDDNERGIAICALLDITNRDIRFVYYTYSAESATDLIPLSNMNRNDMKYAIQLANIYTAPGSVRIVQSNITDTRLNADRCGAVSSISQFDTTNLYNQIQSDLASFKSTEQAEFQEWFENLQTVLDSNTAAHLQNEIDGLSSSKANKSDITNISITGTTNNTGGAILSGTLFYLNGTLCKTLVNVDNGATFTDGTNYAKIALNTILKRQVINGFGNYRCEYRAIKCGNVITLSIKGITSDVLNQDMLLLQLPQDYRPNEMYRAIGFYNSGAVHISSAVGFNISTAGNVTTYSYEAFNGGLLVATYVI